MAETIDFDADAAGAVPSGWTAGVTGRGASRWTVEPDVTAPSKPNVLKQSARGDFPWCVKNDAQLVDGYVEVKFKPIAGKDDQAGGVVWRWKDGDNYYVARANALEDNVSLYYTQNGRRITIKYVDAPVARTSGTRCVSALPASGFGSRSTARSTSTSTTSTLRVVVAWACGPRPTASPCSMIHYGTEDRK